MEQQAASSNQFDLIIVGAGLSGIGAACQFMRAFPQKRYVILEARDSIGGTWDLFRYPGVRSDSDMHTFCYSFRPWMGRRAIVSGGEVLSYIEKTAQEYGVLRQIRFGHSVQRADWCSAHASWTVAATSPTKAPEEGTVLYQAPFIFYCGGYYAYEQAHRPEFPGESEFQGTILQPQFWPRDLDYSDKEIVVVGSGATAVTLVPAMASSAARVTMLQRSPTYVVSQPREDRMSARIHKMFPSQLGSRIVRWKSILTHMFYYRLARQRPQEFKRQLVRMAASQLGTAIDISHFTPTYNPWDQRLCIASDGDLFRAIRGGHVAVETDSIERFTRCGIKLASGKELSADIVVLATGLKFNFMTGIKVAVDGSPFDPAQSLIYKGVMLSGLPNFAACFGYINASWTLKADLAAAFVCRLLRYMDSNKVISSIPPREEIEHIEPLVKLTSGYVRRSAEALPKQGLHSPWKLSQNYLVDLVNLRFTRIDDGVLQFKKGVK